MTEPPKKHESPLKLEMSFDEALERFTKTNSGEMAVSKNKKQKVRGKVILDLRVEEGNNKLKSKTAE